MARRVDVTRRVGQFTLFRSGCALNQDTRCTLVLKDIHFHSASHYMLYEKASEYVVKVGNYDLFASL